MDQYNPQNPVYPPNNQFPPQQPNQNYPQGTSPNQYPPQGFPQQHNPNTPPTGYPQPNMPPQGYAPQPQYPQQGYPQHPPQQNVQMPNRSSVAFKLEQLIYVLLVSLELLLGVRFVLKLIGANPNNPVVDVLYQFTNIFIIPFKGFFSYNILNNTRVLQSVFEWETLIAIGVFAVFGFIVVKIIDLFR